MYSMNVFECNSMYLTVIHKSVRTSTADVESRSDPNDTQHARDSNASEEGFVAQHEVVDNVK